MTETQRSKPDPRATLALAYSVNHVTTCCCNGAGYLRLNVPVGHKLFGAATPCICQRDTIAKRQAERLRQLSGLSDTELARWTFSAFDPSASRPNGAAKADTAKAMRGILETCMEYAVKPSGWLVLQGGVGTGKTHLAYAIAGAVLGRGISVYARTTPDLLDQLRAGYKDDTYDQLMADMKDAPLLVLDDLGAETHPNSGWVDQALYQIVNHRYSKRLPMVVTTNLSVADAKSMDARLISRLLEGANQADGWTRVLTMPCGDFRRSGVNARRAA